MLASLPYDNAADCNAALSVQASKGSEEHYVNEQTVSNLQTENEHPSIVCSVLDTPECATTASGLHEALANCVPSVSTLLPALHSDVRLSCRKIKRHHTVAQASHHSVMSFLCMLQTQQATEIANQLEKKNGKTRVSTLLPITTGGALPPPPEPDFCQLSSAATAKLERQTQPFYGVAHTFGQNNIMVKVSGCAQLQPMEPGHHYLIVVRRQHLDKAVRLYSQVKGLSSNPTTAVIVTTCRGADASSLLNWNTVQYMSTMDITPRPKGQFNRKWTALTDYRMSVAEGHTEVLYEFRTGHHTMVVTANLAGSVHKVLLDPGATGTAFVSTALVQDLGLPLTPLTDNHSVRVAGGHIVQPQGLCTVPLRLGHFKCKVQCMVLSELPGYPLLLGDPWLTAVGADMSFKTKTVSLTCPSGRVVTLASANGDMAVTTSTSHTAPAAQDDSNVLLLHEFGNTWDGLPSQKPSTLVSGKKLAKWVQRNQVECCQLLMVNELDESSVCASDTMTPTTPLDKWTAAVPGTDPHSVQLKALLMSKAHLCQDELTGLPPLRVSREVIPLVPGASVPNRPMFRYTQPEMAEMHKQVETLLQAGLLRKSTSPFGAPVLFVKKKDGSMRMCVDYRGLNKVTVPNRYPLPRVDDLLDKLQGATVFSSLDLLSGYHQIRLVESDVPKTAFRTPFGLFEYKVMPFGLTNAPSVFMATMNDMLSHLPFCVVYLDDILIFSKSPEEHVHHVKAVLEVLEKHQFLIKLKKCDFFKKELLYLGHVISADGIKPDPKKVEAVLQYPTPTNIHQLRSFMGLVQWFHRSIKDLAKLASPLTDLLQGPVVSKW